MSTTTQPTLRGLLAFGIAVLVSLPLSAHAAKSGDKFDDWTIQCEKPEGMTEEICHAFQVVSATEKEKTQRILHVAIGYPPKQEAPIAIVTAPLGVALQTGLQVKVDEGQPTRFPFTVCMNNGCQAGIKLDSAVIDNWKKGQKLIVTFGNLKRQGLNVPVSLKGLTAALNALKK